MRIRRRITYTDPPSATAEIPPLPFLEHFAGDPPCTDQAAAFALAAEDAWGFASSKTDRRRIVNAENTAKATCSVCPVLDDCRKFALVTQQRWGVWGGTNYRERQAWTRLHGGYLAIQASMKDEAAMSRKFENVPTIPLFSDEQLREPKSRSRSDRTAPVGKGNCPECSKNPVSLIRSGIHWVWRAHYFTTWAGTPNPCRASGVALCVAPEPAGKSYSGIPQYCPHGPTPPPTETAAA